VEIAAESSSAAILLEQMMTHRMKAGYFAMAMVAFISITLFAEHDPPASAYDPGIRPVTPASLKAEKANEDAWFSHLSVLASDDLKGRKTGTPDFIRAAEYVEAQFKAIGLNPAGADGYLQQVGFRSAAIDAEHSSLELVQSDGHSLALKIGTEATLSPNGEGTVSVGAPAVFAGHGLVIPGLGIDDLKGLDLHGKVAVVFGGSPGAVHGPLKAYFRTSAIRWQTLKAAGAVGLITILEPRPSQASPPRTTNGFGDACCQRPNETGMVPGKLFQHHRQALRNVTERDPDIQSDAAVPGRCVCA
jgi:hypothetical protein